MGNTQSYSFTLSLEKCEEKSAVSVPPPTSHPWIQISQSPMPNPPSFYTSPVSHSWVPVAQGTEGLSDLQQPLKEISSTPSQPTRSAPTSPPSLLGPPNKNKVTLKREWPGLLLCRSVSGYLIVTHRAGPLILLFLRQDYSLWSPSPCGCAREKGQIKGISVYPPDLSNWDVRNH